MYLRAGLIIASFRTYALRKGHLTMALSALVEQAKELALWLHENTNEKSVPNTVRVRTGLAILQLSMDIADAIVVLLEARLPGPALSLARPLFEGYVRGLWLLRYASDSEVESFNNGTCPQFPALLSAIGTDAESGGAWIHANKAANMIAFHDLTHGGSEHVKRRSPADGIEPSYPEQELEGLMKFGIEVRIRIGAYLLSLMGNEVAMEELNRRASAFRASS
jgi:Family of unknown function (DUF6988)